jgi:hypothetical protein
MAVPDTLIVPELGLKSNTCFTGRDPIKPLPAFLYDDPEGTVLSRWKLSLRERIRVLLSGEIYHWQQTFGQPLQPVTITTNCKVTYTDHEPERDKEDGR